MRAYMPPYDDDGYVWLEDAQSYARRSQCEWWRGRRWVLRGWADQMRTYRGYTPEEMDARTRSVDTSDTVRARRDAVMGEGCFPGG